MNKRTHFFIKIYLSHLIRNGRCFLCVRVELETGTYCYILTQVLLAIAVLLSHSDWAETWVTEGPIPLFGAVSHSAGILSPTSTGTDSSSRLWHLVI